jgi:hypothetical protein
LAIKKRRLNFAFCSLYNLISTAVPVPWTTNPALCRKKNKTKKLVIPRWGSDDNAWMQQQMGNLLGRGCKGVIECSAGETTRQLLIDFHQRCTQ